MGEHPRFRPASQRIRVKRAEEFERVASIRVRRLHPEDLAARAGELVMTFRGSMTSDLERADCLEGAHAVWSMWAGYLDDASDKHLRDWLERHHIGHANARFRARPH
jgi:ribonuclease J